MIGEHVTCAACGQPLVVGDPGVVIATEVLHTQEFGGEPADEVAGPTVFFHGAHAPPDSGHYRVTNHPS